MNWKSIGLLGTLVVASTLSFKVGQDPADQRDTSGTDRRQGSPVVDLVPTGADPGLEDGPWTPICDHFGVDVRGRPDKWSCIPTTARVLFMVASVPDPEITHLALYVDRALESIAWAAADSGYVLESYWMPWNTDSANELPMLRDRKQLRLDDISRREKPGLLVFRPKNGITRGNGGFDILAIFVAGETPTSGVNRIAFQKALDVIRTKGPAGRVTPILGPTYSGSFSSLAAALQLDLNDHADRQFHIISGTASHFTATDEFKTRLHVMSPESKYEAVIESDERASELFLNYIHSEWPNPQKIAILAEDETEYSNVIQGIGAQDPHKWLALRYPREISRLRNAYLDQVPAAPPSPHAGSVPIPGIPLALKDAHPDKDSIPEFSKQQGPASQEAALNAIATALRRQRVQYAGIVATDALDSVFLSRFLRRACPDLRIFTFDADLLFAQDERNAPLDGILAITTYPLFSRNQHWTNAQLENGAPRLLMFSSHFSEGTYNACRTLLPHEFEPKLEYRRPFLPDERKSAEWPKSPEWFKPPEWLTVLGNGGYWPVALLDEGSPAPIAGTNKRSSETSKWKSILAESYSPKKVGKPESFHPEEPSRGWYLCFWLLLLLCVLHGVYVVGFFYGPPKRRKPYLSKIFSSYPDSLSPRNCPFLAAASLALATALFEISQPVLSLYSFAWAMVYGCFAGGVFAALVGTAARLTWRGRQAEIPYLGMLAAFWICCAGVWGVWLWLTCRSAYQTGHFFAYRALQLTSGVSPAVPLLLLSAAFYLWARMHLLREREDLTGTRRLRLFGPVTREFRLISHHVDKADRTIWNYGSKPHWLGTIFFMFVWFLLFWPHVNLRTFENAWFGYLYMVILGAVYFALALTWIRFLACWQRLRPLLEAIEHHPIRYAFSSLRKEIAWVPLVPGPSPRMLATSIPAHQSLRRLLHTWKNRGYYDPQLMAELSDLEEKIGMKLMDLQNDPKEYQKLYDELQDLLKEASNKIVQHLSVTEWCSGDSLTLRQGYPDKLDTERILKEEFIALRLVTFMRRVFRHLRNLLQFMILGFMLAVLSVNSYPFQGRRWIGLASGVILFSLVIGIGMVLWQMDKDPVMSRLTDTKSNEVGRTFFLRLAGFGALPLATVLASQFPSINNILFAWLRPVLEALR